MSKETRLKNKIVKLRKQIDEWETFFMREAKDSWKAGYEAASVKSESELAELRKELKAKEHWTEDNCGCANCLKAKSRDEQIKRARELLRQALFSIPRHDSACEIPRRNLTECKCPIITLIPKIEAFLAEFQPQGEEGKA